MLNQNASHVPVATAAKMMGLSKQRIYQMCSAGTIASVQLDGVWLVAVSAIKDFMILQDIKSRRS